MITQTQLQAIGAFISGSGASEDALLAGLRQEFTPVHFTYCSDDDIGGSLPPVQKSGNYHLYLIDGRTHCLALTNDPEIATGIVVAEICPDD